MMIDFDRLWSLALLASLVGQVTAYDVSKDQECVAALVDVYGSLTFVGVGYGSYYDTVCANKLAVTSLYASSKTHCTPREIEDGFRFLQSVCEEYSTNGTLLPESALAANLTDDAIRRMRSLGLSELRTAGNLTVPVLLSQEVFRLAYRTEDDWDASLRARRDYGYAMYGFWAGILLVGMIQRLAVWLFQRGQPSTLQDDEDYHRRSSTTFSVWKRQKSLVTPYYWIRTYVITPSVLRPYHRKLLFGCTVPTRVELFVVLSCWTLNIVLCGVNIRGFEGNFYWSKVSLQSWRYISDRTGVMSFANIPILWMFSGRNNIFIWATGWSFSTFNTFHKHVARIAALEAIIHSIGYTVFYRSDDGSWHGYIEEYKEQWFYLGVAGTVSMSFLILFSFSVFRRRMYEAFLIVHIVLAAALIFFLFRHTSTFDGKYDPYLWTPVAIWGFDRLLRVSRLIYCNMHVSIHRGASVHRTKSTVSYDIEAYRLSIDVIPATSSLKPGPGQHYYLYQPFRLTGWENHPFTLAAWQHGDSGPSVAVLCQTNDSRPKKDENKLSLSFWLRPCDGWTRHLKNQCIKSSSATVRTTILIEGPYGKPEPLWQFDQVLLVAGGSGISAAVPYLRDHMDRSESMEKLNRTTSITLLWVDRSESYIRKQHSTGVLARALFRTDIAMELYTTSSTENSHWNTCQLSREFEKATEAVASKDIQMLTSSQPVTPREIIVHHRRPDLMSVIENKAKKARESKSRLAVYVCGPPGLADATRDAAYTIMKKDRETVEYFEEAFGW